MSPHKFPKEFVATAAHGKVFQKLLATEQDFLEKPSMRGGGALRAGACCIK